MNNPRMQRLIAYTSCVAMVVFHFSAGYTGRMRGLSLVPSPLQLVAPAGAPGHALVSSGPHHQ
jgi:hypothetical protein